MKLNGTTGTLIVVAALVLLYAAGQAFPQKAPQPQDTTVAAAQATKAPAGEGIKMPAISLDNSTSPWGSILWMVAGVAAGFGIYFYMIKSGKFENWKCYISKIAVEGGELNGIPVAVGRRKLFGLSGTIRSGVYTEEEAQNITETALRNEVLGCIKDADPPITLNSAKTELPALIRRIKASDLILPDDLNYAIGTISPGAVDFKEGQETILQQEEAGSARGRSFGGAVKAYMKTNGCTREEAEAAVTGMMMADGGYVRINLSGKLPGNEEG